MLHNFKLNHSNMYTPHAIANLQEERSLLRKEQETLKAEYKAIREEGHWRGISAIERRQKEIKARLPLIDEQLDSLNEAGIKTTYGECGERTDLLGDLFSEYIAAEALLEAKQKDFGNARDFLYSVSRYLDDYIEVQWKYVFLHKFFAAVRSQANEQGYFPTLDHILEIWDDLKEDELAKISQLLNPSTNPFSNVIEQHEARIIADTFNDRWPGRFSKVHWIKSKVKAERLESDYDVPCPVCGEENCPTWGADYPGHEEIILSATDEEVAELGI